MVGIWRGSRVRSVRVPHLRATTALDASRDADLLIMDVADFRTIPYHFGTSHVRQVIARGRPVVEPNSLPRSASRVPISSNSSVGNGPEPTRVE